MKTFIRYAEKEMEHLGSKTLIAFRELESERVVIKVGREPHQRVCRPVHSQCHLTNGRQEFFLPKDLLCSRSTWFHIALRENRFQEGVNKAIEMPDDLPDVFEAFVYFIYRDELSFVTAVDGLIPCSVRGEELILLAHMWTFGDKYMLSDFQNSAMHRLCVMLDDAHFREILDGESLTTVFHIVKPESPIRLLVTDFVAAGLNNSSKFTIEPELATCPGFLQALHESEAAYHDLGSQSFPRYNYPSRFEKLLYVDHGEVIWSKEPEHTAYDARWNCPPKACDGCGFLRTLDPECKKCKLERWECDLSTWSYLCYYCIEPRE